MRTDVCKVSRIRDTYTTVSKDIYRLIKRSITDFMETASEFWNGTSYWLGAFAIFTANTIFNTFCCQSK